MFNKIIIGVLVFSMLISGGLGAYSVNLNRQIDTLSTQVIAFEGETATEISDVKGSISTLDTELTAFKGETTTQVSGLRGSISTLGSELTDFKGATTTQISGLRGSISTLDTELTTFKGATTTQISGLRGSISTLDTELTAFKGETTTQVSGLRSSISTLDTELTDFKGETTTQISGLRGSISTLGSELTDFKGATTTQISGLRGSISTLGSELTDFKGVTTTQISGLRGSISTLDTELTAFKGETTTQVSGLRSNISTLDTAVSGLRGSLSTLDSELTDFKGEVTIQIADITTEISQSTINVPKIYESIIKGVVEITDGEWVYGSGFILDTRGYIITAQHVIDGLTQIDVILYDGTIASASIVGSSEYSDVAVLRLKKPVALEPLELADSNAVVPGEPVIAVGTPYGLSRTVTAGIVSKTNVAENYMGDWLTANLIQFDAAANPGNSGGLLLNSQGEIIGMVVAGMGNEINWAVSSNKIKRVANAIIGFGSFDTATLPGTWGISNLSSNDAKILNMETTNGVLFLEADGVGDIKAGDIVVAVDGAPVRDVADLFNYFGEYKSPGDSVTLTVIRGKIEVKIVVKLVKGWVTVG